MAAAMEGSLSHSSQSLISSTPSLSSTPLVAPASSTGSTISRSAGALSTIVAPVTPPPSIRFAPNVSPATSTTLLSSSLTPSSVNLGPSSPAHPTPSSIAAPPLTINTSSAGFSSSASSSPPPNSIGFSSPASIGFKPTSSQTVSSKASANSTTAQGSSTLSLPLAVASKVANATSSTPARVNGSTMTHTFAPQVSTSNRLPSRPTISELSPTSTLNNFSKPSGFFANHGAVAGVFVVVALAVLGLAVLLYIGLKRYCRGRSHNSYATEPTSPELEPSYYDHMHYRRASQMRALGNVRGAGASRPLSGRSIASEESHGFSRDTHHSTDPIISSTRLPNERADAGLSQRHAGGHRNGHKNEVPFPQPTKPFAQQSRASVTSAVESSPSIYPPTLPSGIDKEEENYWRQQGFERIVDSQESERIVEKHPPQQQFTPPESMLGLWSNASQSTFRQHSSSEENELVGNLDPRMEATSVHKGSTAPIAYPPRLQLRDV